MNKKGFTLVEMLTTIVVIFLIASLAVPGITGMLKKSEDNKYMLFKQDLFLATETYIQKYIDSYPELEETDGSVNVSLQQLIDEKLVKSTMINPKYCVDNECTAKRISTCNNENNCIVDDYTITVTKAENGTYNYSLIVGGVIEDTTEPTLSLSKKTYIEEDFSEWEKDNSSVQQEDGKNVLVMGTNVNASASATSKYYDVDGGFWEIIFDGFTSNEESQGLYWESYHYDENLNQALTNDGYAINDYSVSLPLNEWQNGVRWYNEERLQHNQRWGPNVKKVRVIFVAASNLSSRPPVKLRNFRIYGDNIKNKFYLIDVDAKDNTRIKTIKYAKGNKDKSYFKSKGKVVRNNQFKVTQNGVYTVYVSDIYGNDIIDTITIDKIVE